MERIQLTKKMRACTAENCKKKRSLKRICEDSETMEQFDDSEVREIGIDDRDYPKLLRKIKKPPKALRIRGNLPPNQKIIAISGSRKTTQSALDTAYRIGRWLSQHGHTIVTGLDQGCDAAATVFQEPSDHEDVAVGTLQIPTGVCDLQPWKSGHHKAFS